jgi:hypothetical protein
LFGHVEWIKSEQHSWYQRKWWALSSLVTSTCEVTWVMRMSAVSTADFIVCFRHHIESIVFHLLPNFTQIFKLNHCCKNRPLILATSYQRHNFHITGVNA